MLLSSGQSAIYVDLCFVKMYKGVEPYESRYCTDLGVLYPKVLPISLSVMRPSWEGLQNLVVFPGWFGPHDICCRLYFVW